MEQQTAFQKALNNHRDIILHYAICHWIQVRIISTAMSFWIIFVWCQARCIWWSHFSVPASSRRSCAFCLRSHCFPGVTSSVICCGGYLGRTKQPHQTPTPTPVFDMPMLRKLSCSQGDDVVTVVAVAPAAERCVWTVSDSEARFWTILNAQNAACSQNKFSRISGNSVQACHLNSLHFNLLQGREWSIEKRFTFSLSPCFNSTLPSTWRDWETPPRCGTLQEVSGSMQQKHAWQIHLYSLFILFLFTVSLFHHVTVKEKLTWVPI